MSTKLFLKNILLNNTSQGLQFGSRWLFNITLINILSIHDYAIFSFVYSASNILMAFMPFGSPIFLINETQTIKKSKKTFLNSIYITSLIFIATLSLYFILTPFLEFVKGWDLLIYGIVLGFVLSLNLILFSFYKGAGDFLKELKAYIYFFLLLILFIGYLFLWENPVSNLHFIFIVLIAINLFVFVLSILLDRSILKDSSHKQSLSKENLKQSFLERKYFGYQDMVTALYTQSGMILLFYLLDTETYGYYRALFVIIAPVYLITVSMSQVVLSYLKKLSGKSLLKNFRKLQLYSFLVGFGILLLLYFFKDFIFQLIKVPSNDITLLAFVIVLVTALTRFVFANYEMLLIILDKQKFRFYIVFIVAIINIVLVFMLLPKYGLIGAVSTNFFTYFALLVGLLYFTEKLLKLKGNSD
ncbi:polysaccharide biosynthesis C-terminal domain-containing protein [Aequorivita sinensis]|uniref:oligosaccharide flippase family protein n=1 Tax=Aequorivita sinensis TaxID=1382458 RepID=UPI002300BB8E|nr:polysaccharide biosynthesis C-terminal domain-containing protein [Aequorivita sinensis]